MAIFKRPYVVAIAAILPPIIFYVADKGVFGRMVGSVFPCVQQPMNSFPCSVVYDFYAMAFAVILGVACLILLAIHLSGAIRSDGNAAKKLWVLVPIVLIVGSLSFAANTLTHSRESISAEQAIQKVRALPEVQEWLALFTNMDGTSPKTGGRPVISIENDPGETYSVHVYESMSDHTATFNWYDVDKTTGEIEKIF